MRPLGICESLLALSALSFVACGYDNGPEYRYNDQQGSGGGGGGGGSPIYNASIDTDATLENVVAGQGVGMMIEYRAGGTWDLQFSCDTAVTNLQCYWSIDIQSLDGSAVGGVDQQHLDSADAVTQKSTSLLWYDGVTTTELDEFTFQASPGNPIGFDVWLQDEAEPNRYIFWISDGWLNKGIAGPSFDLQPNSP